MTTSPAGTTRIIAPPFASVPLFVCVHRSLIFQSAVTGGTRPVEIPTPCKSTCGDTCTENSGVTDEAFLHNGYTTKSAASRRQYLRKRHIGGMRASIEHADGKLVLLHRADVNFADRLVLPTGVA